MIAALPMYDFTWVRDATDRFWATLRDNLRRRGIDAPERLDRSRGAWDIWKDQRLLVAQTCGYPFYAVLRHTVEAVAAPIYSFTGCEGPYHRSFLVARAGDTRHALTDFRESRAAVNGFDSNTGMNLFRAEIAPLAEGKPFFSEVVETGSHAGSLTALVEDRADLAAIDCVSYAFIARGMPQIVRATKVVFVSRPTPALPFIVSKFMPAETRAAVRHALRDMPPFPDLGFAGVAFLPETAYVSLAELERAAAEQGYPQLA